MRSLEALDITSRESRDVRGLVSRRPKGIKLWSRQDLRKETWQENIWTYVVFEWRSV